jgi:hypothetical protein
MIEKFNPKSSDKPEAKNWLYNQYQKAPIYQIANSNTQADVK